jgi:hypothetical protein
MFLFAYECKKVAGSRLLASVFDGIRHTEIPCTVRSVLCAATLVGIVLLFLGRLYFTNADGTESQNDLE